MKIMQIITLSSIGGATSVVINLSNELIKKGFEVVVVSNPHGDMWDLLDSSIITEKVDTLKREISPIDEFRTLFKLRELYIKHKPDIIHLHSSKAGILGRLALPCQKIIFTVHGFDTILRANKKFLVLEKMLKNCASKIVAVSKYDKENLKRENITNVLTIPNGVPSFSARVSVFENSISDRLSELKKDYKLVFSLARYPSKPKRFDLLEEVANFFLDKNVAFIVMGNDKHLTTRFQNIHFFGEVANASLYLKHADLYLLLSDYEGMPMSILEALSVSIPVVSSDVGGVGEIFLDGGGVVVENIAEKITSEVDKLLFDKDLAHIYSTQAKTNYQKNFTISKMVDSYIALYRKQ